jgi:hypothetical protein
MSVSPDKPGKMGATDCKEFCGNACFCELAAPIDSTCGWCQSGWTRFRFHGRRERPCAVCEENLVAFRRDYAQGAHK